jgi:hypothetical protein
VKEESLSVEYFGAEALLKKHLRIQSVPSWVMLFKDTVSVYSENRRHKYINTKV